VPVAQIPDSAVLQAFFDGAPVGLGVWDTDLRYVRVNSALAQINGVEVDAHPGRRPSELLGELGGMVEEGFRRVLETGEAVEVEVTGHTPAHHDEERHWLARYYPLRGPDGTLHGIGAVVVDVSDRRRAEADRERLRRRAEFLATSAATLASSLDTDATVRAVVEAAVPDLGDWGACAIVDGDEVRLLALAHADPADHDLAEAIRARWPQPLEADGPVPTAIRTRRAVVAEVDPAVERLRPLAALGATSILAVPLVAPTGVLGAIGMLHTRSGRLHGPDDLETAQALADRAAVAIAHARAYEAHKEIASTLQGRLLPPSIPAMEGVEVATRYRAAGRHNEVGGDFYDVVARNGRWLALVGDVAGNGAEAAALTASVRQIVRTGSRWCDDATELARVVNEELLADPDARTCTLAIAGLRADGPLLRVDVTLAGHPLPYILRADGTVETAGREGTLLGGVPQIDVETVETVLAPGDLILLYTDGTIEVGRHRRGGRLLDLAPVLAGLRGADAAEVVRRVEEAAVADAGPGDEDDIALVCLRRRP
jgi:PAS domain S-box-containing protein